MHALRPVIDRAFSFDDARSGWAHFARRKLFGKVVLQHHREYGLAG